MGSNGPQQALMTRPKSHSDSVNECPIGEGRFVVGGLRHRTMCYLAPDDTTTGHTEGGNFSVNSIRSILGGCMATATEPIINILGERVALGPPAREQLPLFARWRNDFFVQRTPGAYLRRSRSRRRRRNSRCGPRGTSLPVHVYERATWRPIGLTHLSEIDWRGRTASFGIVLGEADARGRGYGTEATRLLLDYAFTALGLHSVMLITDSFNLAGQAAYRKAGFKEFGRRRQCSLLSGQLLDLVYMDCLASEFVSPVRRAIFAPDTPR